ncbi:uncharacterized protein BX663DRAFT_495656 [Cokeromyces recurvatus]|uniref:uncharacterized protein n=1 Tax=Cokeromyces recurvatus TaxID=90255 RepID=UPI00221EE418|nr:uncharacterized protein BX663DRAFT_495656 [Cokeromyces recurvatus]KAI7907363.1 hypothetical protein BX663DRAFT_495656 [Cokeromyces recurvatus]
MIKNTLIKAANLQLYKTTLSRQSRFLTMCTVDKQKLINKHNNNKPQWLWMRSFVSIPESVVIKPASAEDGIGITEKAVKQLKIIQQKENDTEQMLRILVDSGGCHGYQNKMELTKTVDEEDIIFEKEGVRVVIDNVSLQFLRGSVLDYVQELIGSTFQVIDNPNAKHSCGCNISYDIDFDKIQQ